MSSSSVTLSVLILVASSWGLPVITLEVAIGDDPPEGEIEVEGWVSVQLEDVSLCENIEKPRGACVWLELTGPGLTRQGGIENCRKIIHWYEAYDGRKVILRGVLHPGKG